MPLFMIRRGMKGHSEAELDAAMFRSLVCTNAFREMRWVRSYWSAEREESLCVYEAASIEDVHEFSQMAHLPCDDVWEVSELIPDHYWAAHEGSEPALAR